MVRTEQRGVYAGAMQSYMGDVSSRSTRRRSGRSAICGCSSCGRTTSRCAIRTWFPMAIHLLEGLFLGMRNSQQIVGQRQQLLALGALSAGLTHELNNPAAAASGRPPRCASG